LRRQSLGLTASHVLGQAQDHHGPSYARLALDGASKPFSSDAPIRFYKSHGSSCNVDLLTLCSLRGSSTRVQVTTSQKPSGSATWYAAEAWTWGGHQDASRYFDDFAWVWVSTFMLWSVWPSLI